MANGDDLAEALAERIARSMPLCRGRRPHLRDYDPRLRAVNMRAMVLGAPIRWFPVILSTVAIPEATDKLAAVGRRELGNPAGASSLEVLEAFPTSGSWAHSPGIHRRRLWEAIQRQAGQAIETEDDGKPICGSPSGVVFTADPARNSSDFRLRAVTPPARYTDQIEQVVLVERLREVQALVGFTRIDSPGELAEPGTRRDSPRSRRIARHRRPGCRRSRCAERASLSISTKPESRWLARGGPSKGASSLSSTRIRVGARHVTSMPPDANYPGLRYACCTSFSHALIRQLALECGYTAASIRERNYSRPG